jgi:hypothetical protein
MATVELTIKMSAVDFEYMFENGSWWSDAVTRRTDADLAERYTNETNPGHLPRRTWKREHTVGPNRVQLMLARSFLEANDIGFEIIYDNFTWDNGMEIGWLLLTDFDPSESPEVRDHKKRAQDFHAGRSGDSAEKEV